MITVASVRKNNILNLLDQRDMSIYRLAKEVDMEYKSIFKLAKSETIPDGTYYSTIRSIAKVLDVSMDDLEVEIEDN